jgi:hypothetical protein
MMQRVAAAELSVQQDLSKEHGPTGSMGRRQRLHLDLLDSDGYGGVHCGKLTTRPHDLPGAGRCVSPMLGIFGAKFLHADLPTGLGPGSE